MRETSGFEVAIYVVTLVFGSLLWCGTNTDGPQTKRVLEDQGLHEIHTGGYGWFQCNDWVCTEFTAKNAEDKSVSGAVGCGLLFKGCTVRWSR
jgi:hypothetical protein